MKAPADSDPAHWHRFFAASANNAAWTLAELPSGEFDPQDLLDAAHAAAWHWAQIGNEQNRMRARTLLALAHARAGAGTTALVYADEVRAYFVASAETPDWEIAMAHAIHAYAAAAADAPERLASSYAEAKRALDAIVRSEDRKVVERVLRLVPVPGVEP
ncbi:MAG TPA: hypothetical protein VGN65_02015 [Casimicrobiaceae bacterium]|jgi:hypothetical protein